MLQSHLAEQIAANCVSALVGGAMFYLWWRMCREDQLRSWRLYGWYCGLMLSGGCFGAVAWASFMMYFASLFTVRASGVGRDTSTNVYLALHCVTYAIEFMCASAAKLMVLERMSDFVAPHGGTMRKWWVLGGRIVMTVVVLGNATGLAACIAAAVRWIRSYEAASKRLSYFAANNTAKASELFRVSQEENANAYFMWSAQQVCEVAVLLFIVAAFLVTGAMCARRISTALYGVQKMSAVRDLQHRSHLVLSVLEEAASQGRNLQLRMVATTTVVFAAFLLRSVLSTMIAVSFVSYASFLSNDSEFSKCPGVIANFSMFCDSSCANVNFHIWSWLFNTPEFRPTIVLISSPLVMLVALWGMTTQSIWQRMKPNQRADVPLQAIARG
jgi:hypothetical protein